MDTALSQRVAGHYKSSVESFVTLRWYVHERPAITNVGITNRNSAQKYGSTIVTRYS